MSENVRFSLKPKQFKAIELLVNIGAFETLQDVARTVGVTDRTLRRWKNNPKFQQALNERFKELFKNAIDIRRAILEGAMKGRTAMIKLYY